MHSDQKSGRILPKVTEDTIKVAIASGLAASRTTVSATRLKLFAQIFARRGLYSLHLPIELKSGERNGKIAMNNSHEGLSVEGGADVGGGGGVFKYIEETF